MGSKERAVKRTEKVGGSHLPGFARGCSHLLAFLGGAQSERIRVFRGNAPDGTALRQASQASNCSPLLAWQRNCLKRAGGRFWLTSARVSSDWLASARIPLPPDGFNGTDGTDGTDRTDGKNASTQASGEQSIMHSLKSKCGVLLRRHRGYGRQARRRHGFGPVDSDFAMTILKCFYEE
jgi:hypothetical protein